VRLAAPTDLARSVLGPWLDEFQALHPDIELALHLSDGVQDLVGDALDLALRYGHLPDSGLVARKLCETRRITCAAPAYLARRGTPRTPEDLAGHNCLTFRVGGRNDATWHFVAPDGRACKVRVRGDRRSDDSALVKLWAVEGRGIVNKSDIDLEDELAGGRLVRLLADHAGPRRPLEPGVCQRAPAARAGARAGRLPGRSLPIPHAGRVSGVQRHCGRRAPLSRAPARSPP
jgi:DNA-binding transcriptional LysR family regulator